MPHRYIRKCIIFLISIFPSTQNIIYLFLRSFPATLFFVSLFNDVLYFSSVPLQRDSLWVLRALHYKRCQTAALFFSKTALKLACLSKAGKYPTGKWVSSYSVFWLTQKWCVTSHNHMLYLKASFFSLLLWYKKLFCEPRCLHWKDQGKLKSEEASFLAVASVLQ